MNVLVILSGIADPKWQLPDPLTDAALRSQRHSHPLLSPFDEAALELALKLRDADPQTKISVLIAASSAQDKLLPQVASLRIDQVVSYPGEAHPAWDSATLGKTFANWIRSADLPFDLVFLGREFGDEDDGSVPAATAAALAWPLVSQTMEVQGCADGTLQITRQLGAIQEQLSMPTPLVSAVTNHSRNKLRHPLLKNVMMAKKLSFSLSALPMDAAAGQVRLRGTTLASPPTNTTQCQMIEGDTATQARALAQLLMTTGDTE
ncbi:MAG TPA: hypothetical protein PLL92_00110 [Alicycliphilus sp.]|nr:hypothetical protein [Alicycliphilus sp.]